jgi:NADH:ubiquinone oxidoreductase subunit H
MQTSLVTAGPLTDYSTKEFGPIIVALAFVIAVGGVLAAAIILCGWRGARSISMNLAMRQVAIVCR